jgi:hypothetical protein
MPAAEGFEPNEVLEQVKTLFDQALERPLSEVPIAEELANTIVESRLTDLQSFQGNFPLGIREAFDEAVKLTSATHALAANFVKCAELLTPLKDLSEKDLYGIAFLEQYNTTEVAYRIIMLEAYLAFMEEISAPTGKSLSKVIRERFAGRSAADRVLASTTATLVIFGQHRVEAVRYAMLAGASMGLICRMVLYRDIIEKQGSQLGKKAVDKKDAEIAKDVTWELLSHIPLFGELIGPLRVTFKAITELGNKERAVKDIMKHLEESFGLVNDFIQAYISALLAWSEWATGLSEALRRMVVEDLPAFQDIRSMLEVLRLPRETTPAK